MKYTNLGKTDIKISKICVGGMYGWAKSLKEAITCSRKMTPVVGFIIGIVTENVIRAREAPSIDAASYSSSGISCIAAT